MAESKPLIVVVDDYAPTVDLLRTLIEDAGYSVVGFATATEAETHFPPETALLLADYDVLTRGTGARLAAWVRVHHPQVRIILTSGRREELSQPPFVELFMAKPFDLSWLVAAIRSLV